MGWIGCVGCGKFRRDFVPRTFVPVRPVLHRVSKVNQTVPNAPKLYKTHQNMSSGSNGVDWVHWLQKIPTRLHGTNFCSSSAHFAPSFVSQPNGPQCTKILRNALEYEFRVQWYGSGVFISKNFDATSSHELLHQ